MGALKQLPWFLRVLSFVALVRYHEVRLTFLHLRAIFARNYSQIFRLLTARETDSRSTDSFGQASKGYLKISCSLARRVVLLPKTHCMTPYCDQPAPFPHNISALRRSTKKPREFLFFIFLLSLLNNSALHRFEP